MKTYISKLKPFCKKNVLNVVIETPQRSRGKYAYDKDSGLFELSKIMPAGMEFPYDFGFVPGTKAQDGDPLDVLVFLDVCVPVGCLLRCRPIGVIEAKQTEEDGKSTRNDRIVAIPVESHGNSHSDVKSLKEMNKELLKELEEFFINYNSIRGVKFELLGCRGPKTALALIEKATTKK
jgi:inorganic pyrophosphatase